MRRFRISSDRVQQIDGAEFEVEDDATEDEIAEAASEAVMGWISYGWEEIAEEEGGSR